MPSQPDAVRLSRRSLLRRWAIVGGALSLGPLAAACGGAPASPAATKGTDSKPAAGGATAAPTEAAKAAAPASGKKKYEGVSLKYAALASMGQGVEEILKPWLEETGLKLDRGEFEQQEMEDKLVQAMATNTHLADVVQFSSPAGGDVLNAGFMLEMPKDIQQRLDWDDILPIYQQLLSWKGKIYAAPFDGDTHTLAFRRDLAENSDNQQKFKTKYGYDLNPKTGPVTWEEHRNWAEFFTGWDWNKNGKDDDFGFAHMTLRKNTGYWGFVSRASSLAKHPDDPGFFFDIDTGEPRVNNPAWVRALTEWKDELSKWAPKGVLAYGWGEVIQAYTGNTVAMNIGWYSGDFDRLAPESGRKNGYTILPGSKEVYNAKAKKWETMATPSHAPFMAFGGWMMAVPRTTKIPEVAWDMIVQVCNKEQSNTMAFNGISINPVRVGQLDPKGWMQGRLKMDEEAANQYTSALKRTMEHPNVIIDLRLPGWTQYRDALELAISKALAGEAEPQAALNEAADSWAQVTQRLGGPQKQMEIYRTSVTGK